MAIHRDLPSSAKLDINQMLDVMQDVLNKAINGDTLSKQMIRMYLDGKSIQQTVAMFAATSLGPPEVPVVLYDESESRMFGAMQAHITCLRTLTPVDILRAIEKKKLHFDKSHTADGVSKLVLRPV
jgi:hypothetical protein